MRRAYQAKSFEEEKKIFLNKGRRLVASPRNRNDMKEFRHEFHRSSPELRDDREAALVAVSVKGSALSYCSEALQDDFEVAAAAIRRWSGAFRIASIDLRNNKQFVLLALQYDGTILHLAGRALGEDREVVLAAVTKNGYALKHASLELRDDREIVLTAIENHPRSLQYAGSMMRSDREVVARALAMEGKKAAGRPIPKKPVWPCINKALLKDKDIVLLAIRSTPNCLSRFPCYREAGDEIQEAMPWETLDRAARSAIALEGEEAPILSIALQQEPHANVAVAVFRCHATMLSGTSITCWVPRRETIDTNPKVVSRPTTGIAGWISRTFGRPLDIFCPTLRDLAKELIEELPKQTQIVKPKRVFLVFTNDEGESFTVTPWDWDRPLTDFPYSAS
mmetsp:Transcript_97973/g.204369  ORF Transcript_97973/g.204369 Transcript_97973/m.204369 type:complete len:394 (-) Transcript_97973:230-1411(-)